MTALKDITMNPRGQKNRVKISQNNEGKIYTLNDHAENGERLGKSTKAPHDG
jgi:hypothetical protein